MSKGTVLLGWFLFSSFSGKLNKKVKGNKQYEDVNRFFNLPEDSKLGKILEKFLGDSIFNICILHVLVSHVYSSPLSLFLRFYFEHSYVSSKNFQKFEETINIFFFFSLFFQDKHVFVILSLSSSCSC